MDATAEQIRADQDAGLEADNRQCFNAVMASAFDPTTRLNENGVPVVGVWNGDGVVPPAFGRKEFTGTETHYITTGSTSLDNQDLAVLIRKPLGKGYGADGPGQLLVFVHPDQMPAIRRFRATDVDGGYDFIPSSDAPAYLSAEDIIGEVALSPGSASPTRRTASAAGRPRFTGRRCVSSTTWPRPRSARRRPCASSKPPTRRRLKCSAS